MKKKHLCIVLLLLQHFIAFSQSYERNDEYAVLEEYKGRSKRNPLIGIQVKANGCNWTTTDEKGWFVLNFRTNTKEVKGLEFIKDGYVVFNKDAVNQWRIANDKNKRFHVVLCKQIDLINRIKEYYGIFDTELRKEIAAKKEEIQSLKISLREKEERINEINAEYQRRLNDIETFAEKFARIDESEIVEEEYKALNLFRENKINEALKVYEEYELWKKVENKFKSIEEAEHAEQIIHDKKEEQVDDLRKYIPMLSQQIEWMKLGGSRNVDSLMVSLNRIIKAYHIVSDTIYNKSLSIALYDLGCIHEPLVVDYLSSILDGGYVNDVTARYENPHLAEQCFKESADLGYAPAQYHLGRLYECHIDGIYDLLQAKEYYKMAAQNGYSLAIDRLNDFVDFGVRDKKGNMFYYHVLSESKKKGTVKVTYLDLGFATYGETVDTIPQSVIHNGIRYNVIEIGRNAFRLSKVKNLVIPEGIERIDYYAFRSTHEIESIFLPKSLSFIDKDAQSWHCSVKTINLNHQNDSFIVKEDGHLYNRNNNTIALSIDTLKPNDSWSLKTSYQWLPTDSFPAQVSFNDINSENGLYGAMFPSVLIPSEIDTIPSESFYFTSLKTLTLPENIIEIGDRAFSSSNDLMDVVLPKSLQGLRSLSFANCSMMSDVYVFSRNAPSADINSFEDGRSFRCLHVPKGCAEQYSKSKGWSIFNHINDDLSPDSPFYNSLLLRSQCRYLEAIKDLDSVRSSTYTTATIKARCEYLKASLFYQIGDEASALESMENAIIGFDILESLQDSLQLDYALNNNLVVATTLLGNEKKNRLGLSTFVDTYKYAVAHNRYEIIESAEQTWYYIRKWIANTSDSINVDFLRSSKLLSELFQLFLQSHSLQMKKGFNKSVKNDYINSALSLYSIVSEINLKQSEKMRNKIDADLMVNDSLLIYSLIYTKLNHNNELEIASENSKEWMNYEIQAIEKANNDIQMAVSNLAYIIYIKNSDRSIANQLIDSLYTWAIQNPSNEVADDILIDICHFSNKKLPYDYYLLRDFLDNLENEIIPDTINIDLSEYHEDEGIRLYNERDYINAKKHFILAGYTRVMPIRVLGMMCLLGEGMKKNSEIAIRLFKQAINRGDVDISNFLLGEAYKNLGDYKNAFEAFSCSSFTPAKLFLAKMYEEGDYVNLDLLKAVSIYSSLLDDDITKKDAQRAIKRIANRFNSMAYEELYAKNTEKAIEYVKIAINLEPDNGNYVDTNGLIALELGDIKEAVELWNKAYRLQPSITEISILYKRLFELGAINLIIRN